MKIGLLETTALVVIAIGAGTPIACRAAIPAYDAVIVRTFPHDTRAFTEGLFYKDGVLYEATGGNGQSWVRKVALDTGAVLQQFVLDKQYYGEGIVNWRGSLFELTWKSGVGFVHDLGTLKVTSEFHYKGEGWGLTKDGSHVLMSDGTSDIRVLDPPALNEISRIHVTCDSRPIRNLNELEWVKGEIYANVWLTNYIVRINPSSGAVVGIVDVSNLTTLSHGDLEVSVPNGIAYDAAADRLFVTGKYWPSVYQITLSPHGDADDICKTLP